MKKYLFILSMAALAFACTDEQGSTNGEQNKLEWGNASLCIEEPIAPKETLCYHIEFKLDTLAGDGQLAKSLSQVLRDSVLCAGEYATIQEAMAALADSMKTEWKAELARIKAAKDADANTITVPENVVREYWRSMRYSARRFNKK